MKYDIAALGILCAFMIVGGFCSYALLALIIKIGELI
ncbi:hypothetical protein CPL00172_CDS0045 [Escherichia phage BubbaBully]